MPITRSPVSGLLARRAVWLVALTLILPAASRILVPVPAAAAVVLQEGNAAADGAAAEAPRAQPAAGQSAAPRRYSLLEWLYRSLGLTYILVFLGMSFVLVGLIITNIISARRERICPPELVSGFETLLDEKRYQDAYELAKADESFLGNVLSTGLSRINSGYAKASEAMQEAGEEESMKAQHLLSYLGLIGAIAPMVGLFGTVHGMISSFFEIATAGGSPEPQKLADGISRALVTTLIGLAIAIPAIAAYSILRNRYERLELEAGIASDTLMSRFENVGRQKDQA